eukprot:TRINITY_DN30799_c0_g1_i1.p1 TRINITY_DN30799_c0_g1~~TRINITY_DN30799_c0_g1_i1.p1  ORF type:complete len:385 (-),score=120.36 TRINITY_DN30799_c0_g1_i1:136-1290(-)
MMSKMAPLFALLVCCYVALISAELPATTIIKSYGYPCEEHLAPTADGWLLTMERIPHGRNNAKATKGVVMFQHGLTDTSVGVTLNNPTEGLPYLLADAGYEVWLGNNRGNGYSMNNTQYGQNTPQFWAFSWDEMAMFDLPGQIDYVLSVTGASTLSYIGHSEGTIQAFAGFMNSSVASKVNLFVALAPVAYVGNVGSPLLQAMAKFDADLIFELLGVREFDLPTAVGKFLPDICKLDPSLCVNVLNLLMGPSTNLNNSRIGYYLTYEPNPTSVKNMVHWAQMVRSKTYEKFDYGREGNMEHYGQPTPPAYDLTKFPTNLPVALFTGGHDYLADPTDVAKLISLLVTPPFVHDEPSYAHCDPIWAPDAATLIYPKIFELLSTYNH